MGYLQAKLQQLHGANGLLLSQGLVAQQHPTEATPGSKDNTILTSC